MKKIFIISALLSLTALFGCWDSWTGSNEHKHYDIDTINEHLISEISSILQTKMPLAYDSILNSNPATFQQNKLLNLSLINNKELKDKPLFLGGYFVDMLYCNIFKKNEKSIEYLNVMEEIATEMKIAHYFHFDTLELALEDNLFHEICDISTDAVMLSRLDEETPLSVNNELYIVSGGLIEEMYLISRNDMNNKYLRTIMGGRKIVIKNLLLQMEFYKFPLEGEIQKSIFESFTAIDSVMNDKVNIVYTELEPKVVVINGESSLQSELQMVVKTDHQTLLDVKKRIETLRKNIFQ